MSNENAYNQMSNENDEIDRECSKHENGTKYTTISTRKIWREDATHKAWT